MTDREILEGMLEVLSSSEKWVQGSYGVTEGGEIVFGSNPEAVKFCLVGAYQKVTDTQHTSFWIKQLFNNEKSGIIFNDRPGTSYEDVILLIKNRLEEVE